MEVQLWTSEDFGQPQSEDFLQLFCGHCVQLWEMHSQKDVNLEGNQRRNTIKKMKGLGENWSGKRDEDN